MQQALSALESGLSFAQSMPPKIVYTVKDDAIPIAGSERTAYRKLAILADLGLASIHDGKFELSRATRQPPYVLQKLLPSLRALKSARRFGRAYSEYDVNFVLKNIPENSMITMDYKAWDLTKFQTPSDLFVYVYDVEEFANFLKQNKFSEGKNGCIVLLPKIGSFDNEVERAYFDSIAMGGRSTLDAIAIELVHGDKIKTKGQFPIEYVLKVQEDMPRNLVEAAS